MYAMAGAVQCTWSLSNFRFSNICNKIPSLNIDYWILFTIFRVTKEVEKDSKEAKQFIKQQEKAAESSNANTAGVCSV